MNKSKLTWFAIVHPKSKFGYTLDAYPEERHLFFRKEHGRKILGEFESEQQAEDYLFSWMQKRFCRNRILLK